MAAVNTATDGTGDLRAKFLDTFLRVTADTADGAVMAERFIEEGWRPPLPETEGRSPWDAYVAAYRAYQEADPHGATAHPTAHHMHALEAALRVYDPCAEHGELKGTLHVEDESSPWYVRILDEPVHHTTADGTSLIDWTRDGRMVGVELPGTDRKPSPLPDSETERLAAELRDLAKQLDSRARQRDEIGDDDPSEDTCAEEGTDCHTVSAVATWFRAAGMLRRRADELDPKRAPEESTRG